MIFHLFRRTPREDSIAALYGMIVAQARAPAFYRSYGVPDTVNGRFEMVVLHAILLLCRLNAEPELGRRTGQAVFDHFCQDMDASLREMGVGDLGVPREMRRMGEAFYGRQAAYEAALAAPDVGPLVAALARNVFGSAAGEGAERLAAYTREALRHLVTQDGAALGRGELVFPDPELMLARDAIGTEGAR
ncbi:MAG: cytochrome b pre-mRNA-processing protein 3 [Blastocatellia bacterium]|nr:cytochrome b pre-mRNA-processing protein 3 [Blastocatellia bacterium]